MQWERRYWLKISLAQLTIVTLAGCGTLLHPERRGQPAGRLDWGVVLLDGLGLVFFLIPGIIAFAVDFSTGAIYLPPEYASPSVPLVRGKFRKLQTPTSTPTRAEVAAIVSRELDREIELTPGEFVTEPLTSIDDFWVMHQRWLDEQAQAAS